MKTSRHLLATSALALGMVAACDAAPGLAPPEPVDAAWLAAHKITVAGTLVAARRIGDRDGEHVLVLERKAGPSPSKPKSGRIEHIDLVATFYGQAGAGWKQEWTIRDAVDCPGLDSEADFFTQSVGFTDLNGDGRVEVTVPYHLFCGGGIDSQTVKVILREGSTKLAVRGESRVELPGQPAFGGEHQYDKALLSPERAAYKRYLDQVWKSVVVDRRQ